MKRILSAVGLVLGFCIPAQAAPPPLELAGVKYELASAQVGQDGSITNEYVPAGETLASWTTLVGVRHWPKLTSLRLVAGNWLKMIEPLLARKVESFPANAPDNPSDQIIEAWIAAPDKSYLEINLHRFVREEGTDGIRAYQYAQKIRMSGGTGDPEPFLKQRAAVFAALAKLTLSAEKPSGSLAEELKVAEQELAELRIKYNDGYPAIRSKLRAIAEVKQQLGIKDATPPPAKARRP